MKGVVIALDHIGARPAAARLVDGVLDDLLVEPPEGTPVPGSIYAARVSRLIKGQGGVFVELPGASGFLKQAKGLKEGERLVVQVTGYAEPGKAVPVTTKILFKSRYAIATPEAPGINVSRSIRDEEARIRIRLAGEEGAAEGMGVILRSACADAEDAEITEDVVAMTDLALSLDGSAAAPALLHTGDGAHALAWREWSEPAEVATQDGSFEDLGVLDQLEGLKSARFDLPGGAFAYVEPTRALVAVDVNTGPDTSPAAALKANLAALKDLPRQLRLLGLGGQITCDLAPLAKKDRRTAETVLRTALKSCAVETNLIGWTPLGHLELSRKRERLPLSQALEGITP